MSEIAGTRALVQQGYDYSAEQLKELSWGLRFTPAVCMAVAVVGLTTRQPAIHFALAALGILPFWSPAWHPVDRLYNHVLRPLWGGVRLPSNPLPRRIACMMGGLMNLGIGFAFVGGAVAVAYALGAVLITLQIVVISSHFCVASWMFEGVMRMLGRWEPPVPLGAVRELLDGGAELVDVREPDEFARGHLDGARNLPLGRVGEMLAAGRDRHVVFYCRSGLRSRRAVELLRSRGHGKGAQPGIDVARRGTGPLPLAVSEGLPRSKTLPLVVGVLVLAGSWPYLIGLDFPPMTSDAAVWVANGAPVDDDWIRWTLRSPHFAGYRPVAALSYTLNYAIGGFAAPGYRVVNVALHATVACLVFVLYRRLVRRGPRWGAWVATAFFLAHPLVERVVPYLARRSYELSAVFALAAVTVIWDSLDDERWPSARAWLGAGLLGLALLSNETAFATAAVVPLLALHRFGFRRHAALQVLKVSALPAVVVVATLGARTWVLDGLGGYVSGAPVRGGALSAGTYTALLSAPWWLAAIAIAYYSWRAVDSYRRAGELWRVTVVLGAWMLGFVGVSLVSGAWFYRQLYPPLVPLSLLVAAMFACSPSGRFPTVHRLFQIALVSGVLIASPLIHGPNEERMAIWTQQDRLLRELRTSVGAVPEPARVLLVLSYPKSRRGKFAGPPQRITDLPALWTATRLAPRDLVIENFVFYERRPGFRPTVEDSPGGDVLAVPAGVRFRLASDGELAVRDVPTYLPFDGPAATDERSLYVYVEADGRGELLRVR